VIPLDFGWNGRAFGRWTVTGSPYMSKGKRYVECLCDCGTIRVVLCMSLTNKTSQSCGCLAREKKAREMRERNVRHRTPDGKRTWSDDETKQWTVPVAALELARMPWSAQGRHS